MLRNSNGEKSSSLTMAIVSFVVITLWLVFWLIGNSAGLSVPEFDSATAMAYFTPIAGLYFGRRATETWERSKKLNSEASNDQSKVNPSV